MVETLWPYLVELLSPDGKLSTPELQQILSHYVKKVTTKDDSRRFVPLCVLVETPNRDQCMVL